MNFPNFAYFCITLRKKQPLLRQMWLFFPHKIQKYTKFARLGGLHFHILQYYAAKTWQFQLIATSKIFILAAKPLDFVILACINKTLCFVILVYTVAATHARYLSELFFRNEFTKNKSTYLRFLAFNYIFWSDQVLELLEYCYSVPV